MSWRGRRGIEMEPWKIWASSTLTERTDGGMVKLRSESKGGAYDDVIFRYVRIS